MDNLPLISIIIPVYNCEKYLGRAILSSIRQTYKNLEIIIIDDGSTDRSSEIAKRYQKEDKRIVFISKENGGLSSSRNLGINISKGEYIAFLDSDDYLNPQFIEKLYDAIINTNSDISVCDYKKVYFKVWNSIPNSKFEVLDGKKAFLKVVGPEARIIVPAWNKLYKREILESIKFPEGKISEDFYVSYKHLFMAKKVSVTKAKLYNYFQHSNSIIHKRDDMSKYQLEAIDEFNNFCRSNLEDKDLIAKCENESIYIRLVNILDDYWRAYRNKNNSRMAELSSEFDKWYLKLNQSGLVSYPDFVLFDKSHKRFIFERYILEFIRLVKYTLLSFL